jgi:hypothetical protein
MEKRKNFFLKTPIKFSRLTSRFSIIGIILFSTDGKHTKELIMLRQEAPLRRNSYKKGYTAGNGNM